MHTPQSGSSNFQKSNLQSDIDYIIEFTLGRKWMLMILRLIRAGINRPGAINNAIEGLTAKVLNERLSMLVELEVVEKTIFLEIPPHVEYNFTAFGIKLVKILDLIDDLEEYYQSFD